MTDAEIKVSEKHVIRDSQDAFDNAFKKNVFTTVKFSFVVKTKQKKNRRTLIAYNAPKQFFRLQTPFPFGLLAFAYFCQPSHIVREGHAF